MGLFTIPDSVIDYQKLIAPVRLIATSGYVLVLNYRSGIGAEYTDYTYEDAWRETYDEKEYVWTDPVVYWAGSRVLHGGKGATRWSEIKWPDIRGVFKAAQPYGLHFGAAFTSKVNGKRSMLSVARHDRELADSEIAQLEKTFNSLIQEVLDGGPLNQPEKDALTCLKDGLRYAEAAEHINKTEQTVKNRVRSAQKKLNCETPIQAVAQAIERGYI